MRVLILGVSGMLGSAMIRVLSENKSLQVYGSVRSNSSKTFFQSDISQQIISNVDVEHHDSLLKLFALVRPDVVINCVGLIKQLADAADPLQAIPINALLPHRLARLCELSKARLVHMSTDCVFSGSKGKYTEFDFSDAQDLYGKSKFLGEVAYPHTVTLRTSIIGHELQSSHSLVDWFLTQERECAGFTRAIFSGFPTVVMAQIVRDVVIPNHSLSGLYNVASLPISKFDLLMLISEVYKKNIVIKPDDRLEIDRSLNADRFEIETGYVAPDWPDLIKTMYSYNRGCNNV